MTFGYDYQRRYRRRVWLGFAKIILVVAVLLATGLFAYQVGIEQLEERDASLREEVKTLSRQRAELTLLTTQLQEATRNAESRAEKLEQRLARDVPSGDLARILQMAAERLGAGVTSERLGFIIQSAQNRRNCQQPETKRFSLSTPIYKSTNRSVTFANGTITVIGDGLSVRDNAGYPEAWYDPGQPVTLHFAIIGGRESVATGVLPLQHSVVVDNTEFRFTVVAGTRSFVEITGDRCPYP
ncbi:conserved hypothetical protein [uncultured Gammaproteobacteria bacterium]